MVFGRVGFGASTLAGAVHTRCIPASSLKKYWLGLRLAARVGPQAKLAEALGNTGHRLYVAKIRARGEEASRWQSNSAFHFEINLP